MKEYKFILETNKEKYTFDNNRKKVDKCPFCGKSNKDGKFILYKGFTDRGHCYSCGQTSPIGVHTCPGCKAELAFNKYIDTENNHYLDDAVGKCLYCDYHYTPKEYFENNKTIVISKQYKAPQQKPVIIQPKPVSTIASDIFKASLKNYENNNFITFLTNHFGIDITNKLISKYFIGTSKHWPGSTVFWQIDNSGKVRSGKIMLYNAETGKRVKQPYNYITWVHSALELKEYNLKQCLFGEHLLNDTTKTVAIVESEKTAIIASVYLPQFTWVACGSLTSLKEEKCQALKGRNIILFPDVQGFETWQTEAKKLSNIGKFLVSDLLEKRASEVERMQKLDIADYLIKYSYTEFVEPEKQVTKQSLESEHLKINTELEYYISCYWSNYPQAKEMFNKKSDMQPIFHTEYNREYNFIQCSFDDFKNISIN
jgi:hypothetical protein